MRQRLERKISFLVLFIYLLIVIRISRFILFTLFGYLHIFFSTFFYPHFPIRHVQVSGPRFTDTQMEPKVARKFGYDVSVQRYARTPYGL